MRKIETLDDYYDIGKSTKTTKTEVGGNSYENSYKEYSFWDWEKGIYRVFSRSSFQKRFTGNNRDIMDVLKSDVEIGKMHRLMRHIDGENIIMYSYSEKKSAVPANKELVLKLIEGNEKRAKEFLNKIISLGIVQEVKFPNNGEPYYRYFVNPVFTMANSGITLRLYKLFREQLRSHLTPQAIKDLETLLYYELHPDELVAMKYEEKSDDVAFNQKLLACLSNGGKNDSKLRNRISMWLASYPELTLSTPLQDLSDSQLKLIENAFYEYASDNDMDQFMHNTDGLLLPND